jgi:hypothetical protein
MGLLGCGRKRQLLLWAAVDLSRAVDRSDTLALRIATRALEPPDAARAQVRSRGPWLAGRLAAAAPWVRRGFGFRLGCRPGAPGPLRRAGRSS